MYTDKKQILSLLIISIFCITMASAGIEYFGVFQKDSNVRIAQICSSSTYINISSISYPNGTVATANIEMIYAGNGEYYYNFNKTSSVGRYDVRGKSDGCVLNFGFWFEVTENGKQSAEGIVIVFFIIIFIIVSVTALIMLLKTLGHWVELNVDIIDVAWDMSLYLVVFAMYYMSKYYLGNGVIEDILLLCIQVGSITHIFVPVAGLATTLIMNPLRIRGKQNG